MYNDKGNTKYLKLLKRKLFIKSGCNQGDSQSSAIINLPKGTEIFLSDIHGEYEAFLHIMNNCSGVIKEKVDLISRIRFLIMTDRSFARSYTIQERKWPCLMNRAR